MATPSGPVWARPAALHRYRDQLIDLDAALVLRGEPLGEAITAYADANPDRTADHHDLVDAVVVHARGCLAVDLQVGAVAAAFEAIDGFKQHGPRAVPAARLEADAAVFLRALEEHDVRSLLEPMEDEAWEELLWGPNGAPEGEGGSYGGGGAILGPDGRAWPLVVPMLEVDGELIHASRSGNPREDPRTLGGRDAGWRTIEEVEGVTRLADPPGAVRQVGVFFDFGQNDNYPPRPDLLPNLSIDEHGFPQLQMSPDDAPIGGRSQDARSRRDALAEGMLEPERETLLVAGRPVAVDPRRVSRYPEDVQRAFHRHRSGNGGRSIAPGAARQQRLGRARRGLDLAEGLVAGARAVEDARSTGFVRYRVTYATHPDGRRRAEFRAYRVTGTPTRKTDIQVRPMFVYLEGEHVRETLMRFDDASNDPPDWQPIDSYEIARPAR